MTVKATFYINAIKAAVYVGGTAGVEGVAGYRGISESFYTDTEFNSQAQYNLCKTWMAKRAPLLPRNSTIVAFRLHVDQAKGKTVLYRDPVVGANGFIADQSEAALKYKARSTTTAAEREVVLAMIPDDIIIGGCFTGGSPWVPDTLAFFNHLRDNWKMKAIDQTVTAVDVVSISADGVVVLNQPSDIIATSNVQILRSKTAEGNTASGVFKIKTFVDNQHFTLLNWEQPAATKGTARRFVQVYESLEISQEDRLHPRTGTRKIGRPFDQSRGKASKKR